MDNMKIAELLIKIEMDDLKDAEMLADWAEIAKESGDGATAGMIYQRAKTRLNQMKEADNHLDNIMDRLKNEVPENDTMTMLYKKFVMEQSDRIKHRLENM